jgi:hypothetical protein
VNIDSRYSVGHHFLLAGRGERAAVTLTRVAGYRRSPRGKQRRPIIRSSTHAPDQTAKRPRLLHCFLDLAAPGRYEPADRKSAALRLILKGLLSALVAFPTSIKLKSRLFSTCNQLIRICRIPDVMSLADGLRHAPIQFRDRAMRSDKSNNPERLVSGRVFRIDILRMERPSGPINCA